MKGIGVLTEANHRGLRYLVAGGHAVIFHGYPRNTFDLDLVIRRDDRDAWFQCAKAVGLKFLREGPAFLQFDPPSEDVFATDMMMVNEPTFEKLASGSVPAPEFAGGQMVALRHLLALKCHAIKHGHQGRIVKDADDVIRLVQANSLNIEDGEIRETFLKYGTEEFYEKVRGACARK